MNRDPNRVARPEGGGERHTVSVTRMCLRSGSVQLPFALAGRLPQGELLVHETESDEPMMLWSEPPRTLAGLGPLFERHEIQVNDQLVLDLVGDDLKLSIRKRPRRSRPQVTPSTWASHRAPDGPLPDEGHGRRDRDGDEAANDHGRGADDDLGWAPAHPASGGAGTAGAPGAPRPYDPDEGSYAPGFDDGDASPYDPDDDAPRAPRVRVSPLPRNATSAASERGAGRVGDAPRPPRRRASGADGGDARSGGLFGGAWRAAKGWFTRAGDGGDREEQAAHDAEPDWVHAWDADPAVDEGTDAPGLAEPPEGRHEDDREADVGGARLDFGEPRVPPSRDRDVHEGRDEEEGSRRAFAGETFRDDAFADEAFTDDGFSDDGFTGDEFEGGASSAEETGAWSDGHDPATRSERDAAADTPPPTSAAEPTPEPEALDRTERDDRAGPVAEVHGAGTAEPTGVPATAPDPASDALEDEGGAEVYGYGLLEDDLDAGDAGPDREDEAAGDPDEPIRHEEDEASERAAVERAAAWRHEGGVPSRAERFLAGDLRTRLLRFLTSPDMPMIAKTSMIASRFDLPTEVAREMLEDVADDPPRGFRLTPIREGAWRIERTGT